MLFPFLVWENIDAQLYFKNDAPFKVWVAVGYYVQSTGEWHSKGWYGVEPNATKKTYAGNLSYNSTFYYYAFDYDDNYWRGNDDCKKCGSFLMHKTDKFELNSSKAYSGSKYQWKKFNPVNTKGSTSHTVTLSATDRCYSGNCTNGYGTYKWHAQSKKYTGYWKNGKREGQGTGVYGKSHSKFAKCKFVGQWKNNTWKNGTLTYPDKSKYKGDFNDVNKHGKGVFTSADGAKYDGNWRNDKKNGYGKMVWKDRVKTYSGNWVDDSREGRGSSTYGSTHSALANCKFTGQWKNNNWKNGTLTYADGGKYVGDFKGIKRQGKGKLYDRNGQIVKSGEWHDDRLILSDKAPPVITWDVPLSSNVTVSRSKFNIKACVQTQEDLSKLRIYVNNSPFTLGRGFSVEDNCTKYINASVTLKSGENRIYISASNSMGTARSEERIVFYNAKSAPSTTSRYYALLIGVKDYDDLGIIDLEKPIKDTERLKRVLTENYTFPSRNIYHLKNPRKKQIVDKLEDLKKILRKEDYLLIFYSGHGKMQGDEGYWLPSNASKSSSYQWLSSSELNVHIKQFQSKHVLLIADACYSGAFVMRDVDDLPNEFDNRSCIILEGKQSRCAMTSGAKETVPDESVFLKYLLKQLEENPYSCISAEQIYMEIKIPILSNSPNNQIPQFGDIPRTGHEGGNFIFKRR